MLISVIIPTYKPDFYLWDCLDSLTRQTLSSNSFEILLILNGPKDNYEEEIFTYIKNRTNIRYFYSPIASVSNARNIGICNALGKYITFIDSDDWVSENYLKLMLETFEQLKSVPFTDVRCFNQKSQTYFMDYLGNLYNKLVVNVPYSHLQVRSYFSTPVAKLLPTNVCKLCSFSNNFNYGEDALYMFSISKYLPACVKVERAVYFRRVTKGSLSRKKRSSLELLTIHIKLLKAYSNQYFSNIRKYNFLFFITRILAVLKHIIFLR